MLTSYDLCRPQQSIRHCQSWWTLIVICYKIHFLDKIIIVVQFSTFIRHLDHCLVKFANLHYFPLTSFVRSYMVTDKAFIAET